MPEDQCAPRIEKLTGELVALETRRNELADEVEEEAPELPPQAELIELCDQAVAVLEGGSLPQRKAVVEKVEVKSRDHILPIFKIPLASSSLGFFRPPYGSVPPTRH